MDDVLVGSLMSSPVRTVRPDESVRDAAQVMIDRDISSVVVVDGDNQPVGILTSTDCVHVAADGAATDETPVSAYASADLVATTASVPVGEVAETMMADGVHHVPVVDEDEGAVGMITTKDFAAYLSEARAPSPPRPTEQ